MARPSPIPPAIPGDVFQLNTVVTFLAQRCQFVAYYRFGVLTPTQPDSALNLVALANAYRTSVIPSLVTMLSVGTAIIETRTWSLKWPVLATLIDPYAAVPGTRAGDPLPPQIAIVMSKRTNVRGKSGRGRAYLCGMSETDSTNGVPTVAFLAIAAAVGTVLNSPITDPISGKTFYPVVVSTKNYVPIDPAPIIGPFWKVLGADTVSVIPDQIWNTQRRRTFGRGQ